jgi:Kdo2-lipid IVA lauroyltransferase/acyltransferase
MRVFLRHMSARAAIALLWLLHFLPLPVLAALGNAVASVLYRAASKRRNIAERNVELCLPELNEAARKALVREHFTWLTRSLLERGVLWFASPARLKRLIRVEGDVALADQSTQPVMWLVPHFVGLDIAGLAAMLYVNKRFASIYQRQTNAVFDEAVKRGRTRLGKCEIFSRVGNVRPLLRCLREGMPFFNLPDMDFGHRDSVFVPFFGVSAATLTAPARVARSEHMIVQPVVATLLPRGQGYVVRFGEPWRDWPAEAGDEMNAADMNHRFEALIRAQPAQYLWVHKRFKTRPEGDGSLY